MDKSHADHLARGVRDWVKDIVTYDYTKNFNQKGRRALFDDIATIVKNNSIDYVIVNLGSSGILTPDFFLHLKQQYTIKLVLIFPDSEHNFEEQDRYYAQVADINWVMNPPLLSLFRMYGFRTYQGFGLHKSIYQTNQEKLYKDIDVSFIGGVYRADRSSYLNRLSEDGINIELFGHGTKNGRINDEKRDDIIRRSKITLNFTGVENNMLNIFRQIKQNKARSIEVAFLGTFLLTEFAEGCDVILDTKDGAATFFSYQDLKAKIKYFLEHEEEREARARHQQNLCFEKNDSTKVSGEMLVQLENVSMQIKNEYLYLDDIFKVWIGKEASKYIGFFIGSLRFRLALDEIIFFFLSSNYRGISIIQFMRGVRDGYRFKWRGSF